MGPVTGTLCQLLRHLGNDQYPWQACGNVGAERCRRVPEIGTLQPVTDDSKFVRNEFLWPDVKKGPYLVAVTLDSVDGRLEVVGVEMWGREPVTDKWMNRFPGESAEVITSTALRLPLDRIANRVLEQIRSTASFIAHKPDRFSQGQRENWQSLSALRGAQDPGRPPLYNDEHWTAVAQTYTEAVAKHAKPTMAVAQRFNVSKSTAAKWVAKCRKLDLLPPTSRGKSAAQLKTDDDVADS